MHRSNSNSISISNSLQQERAAIKIQKAVRMRIFRPISYRSIFFVSDYLDLIQRCQSTSELADAYNRADILPKQECEKRRLNLLDEVNKLIKDYKYNPAPTRKQIFEIANLSSLDNSEINRELYHILTYPIKSLDINSSDVPDLDKIAAISRMLILLPPRFFAEENHDLIITLLGKLSNWLNAKYLQISNPDSKVDQLLPILEIYANIATSLLDSRMLQQIDIFNRHFRPATKNLAAFRDLSLNVIYGDYLSYKSGLTGGKDYKVKISHIAPNVINSILGVGLARDQKIKLYSSVSKLKNHHDIKVKYLSHYITESISRLLAQGDTYLYTLLDKSIHFMLRVGSLGLMFENKSISMEDYLAVLNHSFRCLRREKRHVRGTWYHHANILTAIISAAGDSSAKLGAVIENLKEFYNTEKLISWQLNYIILKSLSYQLRRQYDFQLKIEFVNLLKQIALDDRYKSELHKAAIEILIEVSSAAKEEGVRSLARRYIKEDIYAYFNRPNSRVLSVFYNRPKLSLSLLVEMDNIHASDLKHLEVSDYVPGRSAFMENTGMEIFPEYRANLMKEKSRLLREGSLVEENLNSYIPLMGSSSDELQPFSLEERVIDFIESKNMSGTPTLLIQGASGAGKSLFSRYIEKMYWDKYKKGDTIPIFIFLPSVRDSFHNVIDQALLSYGFTDHEIILFKTKEKKQKISSPLLLVILDGYDEINSNINIHDAYGLVSWPNIKVIVTCRTEYLDNKSKRNLFSSKKTSHTEVFIRPLDDLQVKLFISAIFRRWQDKDDDNVEVSLGLSDFESLILGNQSLTEIIRNPFILEMVMNIMPVLLQKSFAGDVNSGHKIPEIITRYEIYELFLNRWYKKEADRLRRIARSIPDGFNPEFSSELYAIKVASVMFEKNTQVIVSNNISDTIFETIDLGLSSDMKTISRMLGPFRKIGDMRYGFTHKSIQEFLVAKGMLEDIRVLAEDDSYNLSPNSILNKSYIQKEPSILLFVLDQITQKELDALERIILSTRNDTKEGRRSKILIAAANAATIYVRTVYTQVVSHKDWSYTQIVGAEISNAYFYRMDFTGSDWSNVKARGLEMDLCSCDSLNLTGFQSFKLARAHGRGEGVTSLSSSGNYIFSGSWDGRVRVWDIAKSICFWLVGHKSAVSSVHASDNYLFSGSYDSTVRVWDASTGNCVMTLVGHQAWVTSVCSNGVYVCSGSFDKTVIVWNIMTRNCVYRLKGHNDWVTSVFASRFCVFSGSYDSTVRIWDIDSGVCLRVLKCHNWVLSVYSMSGYIFAGSVDKTVNVWDIEQGNHVMTFTGHDCSVASIFVFGDYLFSGALDNTVRIWNISSGSCVNVLKAHGAAIIGIFVQGAQLISGDENGVIFVWDISDIKDVKMLKAFGRRRCDRPIQVVSSEQGYESHLKSRELFEQDLAAAEPDLEKPNHDKDNKQSLFVSRKPKPMPSGSFSENFAKDAFSELPLVVSDVDVKDSLPRNVS